jgi:hypothetical protein
MGSGQTISNIFGACLFSLLILGTDVAGTQHFVPLVVKLGGLAPGDGLLGGVLLGDLLLGGLPYRALELRST